MKLKATPPTVFIQDKLVAAYNFPTSVLDDVIVDEFYVEVKVVQLVKICVPLS